MAEGFDTEDVQRILKALFPTGAEDPFGELRGHIITIQEDLAEFDLGYQADQEELREELAAIKTRTFGILILQIINILRTLMGLLPAGRAILIGVAAMGLITTFLQSGKVSGADIQAAVQKSGLSQFIREQFRRLTTLAEEQATRIEDVMDLGTEVVRSAATKADGAFQDVSFLLAEIDKLQQAGEEQRDEIIGAIRAVATQAQTNAAELSNITANLDGLIFGAMRAIPERIRDLPKEASALLS